MKKAIIALLACTALVAACKPEPVPVKVQSIKLDQTAASVVEGSTVTIAALVNPSDAENKTLSWASDNTGVATVDNNGTVTGVKAGTAKITASATDGSGVSASCSVTVTEKAIPVEKIEFELANCTLEIGETVANAVKFTPENATNKEVTFASDNENVAKIDAKGVITAIGEGECNVTVTSVDNPSATASCAVTVKPEPKEICLDIPYAVMKVNPACKAITIKGYYGKLEEVVANWGDREDVTDGTWTSSNESVVTVNAGKLTAVGQGTATVTLTDKSGSTATCEVTVLPDTQKPADFYPGISIADCSLKVQATADEQLANGPWSAKKSTLTNAEGYIPGSVCIENANCVNYRLFNYYNPSKPVDISSVENPALYIRLWVEDITKVNWGVDGEIEISSDGSDGYNGSEEINWKLSDVFSNATGATGKGKQAIHNGWNVIVLPFDQATGTIGSLRKNHINFFRIYQSTGSLIQGGNLKLDQVRVINWKQFDPCDDYQMWYDGNNVPQRQWLYFTDDKKEGNGCMGIQNYLWQGADAFRLKFWNNSGKGYEYSVPFDMDEANSVFKFWLYIDKPEFLEAQQINVELSSNLNTSDVYDWAIVPGDKKFTAGWNEFALDFSAAKKNGNADIHQINWLRFVLQFNNGVTPQIITMKVDDIRVEKK